MKGEKGLCIAGVAPNQVRRTRFVTEKDAQNSMEFHIAHGFIDAAYVLYKCSHCKTFHFGKKEWKLQFEAK